MKIKIKHFVIFSICFTVIYTLAEFIGGFWGVNHDGLTPFVYGFFAGEIVCTTILKRAEKDENSCDDSSSNNGGNNL